MIKKGDKKSIQIKEWTWPKVWWYVTLVAGKGISGKSLEAKKMVAIVVIITNLWHREFKRSGHCCESKNLKKYMQQPIKKYFEAHGLDFFALYQVLEIKDPDETTFVSAIKMKKPNSWPPSTLKVPNVRENYDTIKENDYLNLSMFYYYIFLQYMHVFIYIIL